MTSYTADDLAALLPPSVLRGYPEQAQAPTTKDESMNNTTWDGTTLDYAEVYAHLQSHEPAVEAEPSRPCAAERCCAAAQLMREQKESHAIAGAFGMWGIAGPTGLQLQPCNGKKVGQ
jgi:hypothetical protein